jgi:hypothetical protein
MLPTLILLILAISVISLRVIFHLPVQTNEFIVIAEFYNGRSYTLVTDSQGVENISYGEHRHTSKLSSAVNRISAEKMSGARGILPRRDTLFCSVARKIKKLEAGIHLASITAKL